MDDLERVVASQARTVDRWKSVAVVKQNAENADTPEQSTLKWGRIFSLFGARGESQQDEVFAAVNAYFLRNGASPEGKYRKPIKTAGGIEVPSGEVTKVTGQLEGEIRQFLRGRLLESYTLLKENPAFRDDNELSTMAENAGVPREYCWLLADWLGKDCPHFVGDEASMYIRLRTSKIAAAAAKRRVALPDVDRVMQAAPETKMAGGHSGFNGGYNEDVF